jgi:hypothetical protein
MEGMMRKYTDDCYDHIAGELGIDNPCDQEHYVSKTDLHCICRSYFKKVISGKRQATQSQLHNVCKGACHSHF